MTTFNTTLTETMMITDRLLVTRPYAYVTNSVRTMATTLLRLRRRPVRYVSFDLPVHYAYLEPGVTVWASHDQLPLSASGVGRYDTWRLIPLYVVEVSDPLGVEKISVKCIDLREVYCSWWSPLRTDIGMTDDLNGIAIIDRAGGWETQRNQVGYGLRPPGNDAYQEVLPNTPIIDAFGLLTEGGDDTNHLLNSTFSEGAAFDNWSVTLTGAAVAPEWRLYTLIDATGFRRAVQLATYAAGEQAYVSQTVNGLQGKRMAVKVFYKDGGAYDRMRLQVTRSDTGEYLDASDGSWNGSPVDNSIEPTTGTIDTNMFVTSMFLTTSGGTANLAVSVGHLNAASTHTQISQIQGVELISAGSTVGSDSSWRFRSPLPTKAVAVTRARNITGIVNDGPVAVVSNVRGFVKMKVKPHWSNDDLDGSQIKYVWDAELDPGNGFLRVYYFCAAPGVASWHFVNAQGKDARILNAVPIVRDQTYQIIARWTSPSHNEHGLAGQALDLWVDGVQGETQEQGVLQATAGENNVNLGCLPTVAERFSFDGEIFDVTMGVHCPSYEELLRI